MAASQSHRAAAALISFTEDFRYRRCAYEALLPPLPAAACRRSPVCRSPRRRRSLGNAPYLMNKGRIALSRYWWARSYRDIIKSDSSYKYRYFEECRAQRAWWNIDLMSIFVGIWLCVVRWIARWDDIRLLDIAPPFYFPSFVVAK